MSIVRMGIRHALSITNERQHRDLHRGVPSLLENQESAFYFSRNVARPGALEEVLNRLRTAPVVALIGPRQVGKTTLAPGGPRERAGSLLRSGRSSRLGAPRGAHARVVSPSRAGRDRRDSTRASALRGPSGPRRQTSSSYALLDPRERVSLPRQRGVRVPRGAYLVRRAHRVSFERSHAEEARSPLVARGLSSFVLGEDRTRRVRWRVDFVRTFLERDIPELGLNVPSLTLRRFWTMIAHYHGQVWNAAEFARALGSAEATARRYLDVLSGTFVVRQLPPGTRTSRSDKSRRRRSTFETPGSSTLFSASRHAVSSNRT